MEVYSALFKAGPMTANEVFVHLYGQTGGPKNAASNSAARFSELRDMGVIKEVGVRSCRVTGMNVIEWDVTSRLPVKIQKRETNKQIIVRLEREIARLREAQDQSRYPTQPLLSRDVFQEA